MKDGVNKINAAKICLILAVIATILTIARYGQDIFLQNFLSEMAGLLIGIAFTLVIINWIEDHDKKKYWSAVRETTYSLIIVHLSIFIRAIIPADGLPSKKIEDKNLYPFGSDTKTVMSNIDEIAFVWSSRFVKANSRNLTDYLKYKNKSIPKRIIISYDYPYRVVDPAEVVDSNKVLNWADFVRDNYEIYIGSLDSVQRLVPRLEQSNSNPKLISSLIELEFYNEGLYYNMELYNKYRNMLERRKYAEYYASTMFITLYQMIKTSKIVLNEVLNDRGEPYVNLNVFPRFFNK